MNILRFYFLARSLFRRHHHLLLLFLIKHCRVNIDALWNYGLFVMNTKMRWKNHELSLCSYQSSCKEPTISVFNVNEKFKSECIYKTRACLSITLILLLLDLFVFGFVFVHLSNWYVLYSWFSPSGRIRTIGRGFAKLDEKKNGRTKSGSEKRKVHVLFTGTLRPSDTLNMYCCKRFKTTGNIVI